jgi:hypothetical protein
LRQSPRSDHGRRREFCARRGDASQALPTRRGGSTTRRYRAPMSLSRRSFLYTSPLAVLPVLPRECGRLIDEYVNVRSPFLHGVASGDPLTDRVVLWTRVSKDAEAPESVVVSWRVAKDARFEQVVRAGLIPATRLRSAIPTGSCSVQSRKLGSSGSSSARNVAVRAGA